MSAGALGTRNCKQILQLNFTNECQTTRSRPGPLRNIGTDIEALVCLPNGISVGAILRQSQHPSSLPPHLHAIEVPLRSVCCYWFRDDLHICSLLRECEYRCAEVNSSNSRALTSLGIRVQERFLASMGTHFPGRLQQSACNIFFDRID